MPFANELWQLTFIAFPLRPLPSCSKHNIHDLFAFTFAPHCSGSSSAQDSSREWTDCNNILNTFNACKYSTCFFAACCSCWFICCQRPLNNLSLIIFAARTWPGHWRCCASLYSVCLVRCWFFLPHFDIILPFIQRSFSLFFVFAAHRCCLLMHFKSCTLTNCQDLN